MKNSLTKKLLLAVITLGIAVIATVGSTYAWFSMNTTVEATGMQLTAVTPVNVVISKNASTGFANSVSFDKLTENLYPASTDTTLLKSDGTFKFWAVQEGQVIGSNGEGGQAEQTGSNATKFQTTEYTTDGKYVIAQKIYLKTTAGKVGIALDEITLGDATTPSGAVASSAGTYNIADAVYVALLTSNGTYIYSVNDDDDSVIGIKSVVSSSAGDFTYGDAAFDLADSDTPVFGSTSANKLGTTAEEVTVLVWVEGEDPDCVNGIGGLGLSIGLTFKYITDSYEAE